MESHISLGLIMFAIALTAVSGLPGLFLKRSSIWGQRMAVAIIGVGAILGWISAWPVLITDRYFQFEIPWPAVGNLQFALDALSAFFLIPIFLMGGLGSLYSLGYWPQREHPENSRKLHLFWGLLVAGMALLVISRHAVGFLLGWETMALAAFFLVSTEDHRDECRRAAWIYLIATHIGTLALFALFALWRWATGSYVLQSVPPQTLNLGVLNGLFFLALLGFGLKAGVMPLHFWLPGAHANAPSHVSAMLSGVMLKMGIYGLLRVLSLLPEAPLAWGGILLVLGAISGLLGVVFAIGQHDLKRLLAYHSIENIGIILLGMGVAMLGRSIDRPELVVLGLSGCLLHVWNHGLFKSLLFLCAGSVIHTVHTQEIDRLGGLAKVMPWTATTFLIGAVAICGLPPLNGFISELFVYLGLFHIGIDDGAIGSTAVFGAPLLAAIGSLAVACFVKVYGTAFLGTPRTQTANAPREAPVSMRIPMVILAACCVTIGLMPILVSPILDRVVAGWSAMPDAANHRLDTIVPLGKLSAILVVLLGAIALMTLFVYRRSRTVPQVDTWDCGYVCATSRMQYTASSFAQSIVRMFGWVLRPELHPPVIEGLFPQPSRMHSHVNDAVLDRVLIPLSIRVERWFGWCHRFQQGLTQQYVLYILIVVILMLSTLIPIDEFIMRLFE